MPIYEYRCQVCGKLFEALQRIGADGTDLTCPACGSPNPQKMISAFSAAGAGASGNSSSSAKCGSGGFT
ncbi:MAG TPA: zinc ribbon domain-containing protein [bacterium]|nr:zinc ribbon domain-containing protein [bacterium]HNT65449.1 zinc ribbon domain-containing protein [bacterium]HOX87141.1 zinc ribbon domain-containing protein [bacterium]HPG46472.1 zinc ribbon domain-containing protein [bacterium]HPM98615.1 zinc ribbon domain-containing protein [bacterium]